jgi:hypothetical protein
LVLDKDVDSILFVLIIVEEGMIPDTAAEAVYGAFSTFVGAEGGGGGGGSHRLSFVDTLA